MAKCICGALHWRYAEQGVYPNHQLPKTCVACGYETAQTFSVVEASSKAKKGRMPIELRPRTIGHAWRGYD